MDSISRGTWTSLITRPTSGSARAALLLTLSLGLVGLALSPRLARAQAPGQQDPAGVIGVYFDEARTLTTTTNVLPFTPFNVYVGASSMTEVNAQAQLKGFEFQLNIPAGFTVLASSYTGALNFGDAPGEFIVGTGTLINLGATGGNLELARLTLFTINPTVGQDLRLTITPSTPSSVIPAAPTWLDGGGLLFPFRQTITGIINPVPCEVQDAGFTGTRVNGLDGSGATLWSFETGKPVSGALAVDLDGDGEANVLYWTEAGATAGGEIGYLNCQGQLVWEFVDSELPCDPSAGALLDVVAFEVGDFSAANTGSEVLLIATSAGRTRFTVHTLGGALIGGNAELWTDFTYAAHLIDGGAVIAGGVDGTGRVKLFRDGIGTLRGSLVPAAGCLTADVDAVARFDGVDLPVESELLGLALAEGVLTVTGSAGTYELDPLTLDSLVPPCALEGVDVVDNVVRGLDGSGIELFVHETTGPVVLAEVFTFGETPVIIGLADATDSTQAVLFQIDCTGSPVFETALVGDANCFGVAQPRAAVNTEVTGFGSFTSAGATELWAVLAGAASPGDPTLTWVVTVDLVAWQVLGTYLHHGPVTSILPLDGEPLQVAMGGRNDDSGHAVAFVLEAGADGFSSPGCPAKIVGPELWYADFDGSSPTRPLAQSPLTDVVLDGGTLVFTNDAGERFALARADGAAVACGIAGVEGVGTEVVAFDAASNELFRRDVGFVVERAALVDFDGAGDPEIVVAGAGSVRGLTCVGDGLGLWGVDPTDYEICFDAAVATRAVAEFAAPVDLDGTSVIVVVFETTSEARLALLGLGFDGSILGNLAHLGTRVQHAVGDFDGDGALDVLLLGTDGVGDAVLFLVALADLRGATPFDLGACAESSTLFALAWDGSVLPQETDPVSFVEIAPGRVEVTMGSGARYVVDATGRVITGVELRVQAPEAPANPGAVVDVDVVADNAADLAAVQGVLLYDASVLSLVSAAVGDGFVGFAGAINTSVAGEVRFALASATALGASSAIALAVRFEVAAEVQPGSTALDLSELLAFDETAAPIGVTGAGDVLRTGCEKFDVTGDGVVLVNDAILTLRLSVGAIENPTPLQLCAADTDDDGEITAGDAVRILRLVVGLPLEGTSVGRVASTVVESRGPAVPLGEGRYALHLLVRAGAPIAGLDLGLGVEPGFTIESIALGEGSEGLTASKVRAREALLAVAHAEAIGEDGAVCVRVVVRASESVRGFEVRVFDAATFSGAGERTALDAETALVFGVQGSGPATPVRTELSQNTPNPFNPRTEIAFRIERGASVRLVIYDVAGRRVRTLTEAPLAEGEHRVVWLGDDDLGRPVSSGVYVYQLETDGVVADSKRMTLVR